MNRSLRDYEVLSFDCYGTLIDWESGIWAALQPMLLANDATVTRPEVLAEFGRIEAALEAGNPTLRYADLLVVVHRDLATNLDLDSDEDMDLAFGGSVPDWPEFADSAVALAFLSERYRLVILSNVDRTSFAGSNERLNVEFDAIYTAEEIGSYKPDPANFDYLLGHLEDDFDVMPDAVLHVAQSLYHDHAPAKAAGLDTVWIDRQRLSAGGEWGATTPIEDPPEPDHVFFSMADLARAIEED
ncbi:MAG TPA: HAD-IA family hydrolase [Acidimicrobiia bacterium]|jgi:2-haloacid dehalogenase|nr:HAD-IA family hydrolase [Acidimicrobiia bacterium]